MWDAGQSKRATNQTQNPNQTDISTTTTTHTHAPSKMEVMVTRGCTS